MAQSLNFFVFNHLNNNSEDLQGEIIKEAWTIVSTISILTLHMDHKSAQR